MISGDDVKKVRLALYPLVLAVAAGFGLWLAFQILERVLWVLVLVLLALILAAALMPGVRFLRRARLPPSGWRLPKPLAVLVIYLAIAFVFSTLGYLVVKTVVLELLGLFEVLPSLAEDLAERAQAIASAAGLGLLLPSPEDIAGQVQALTASYASALSLAGVFVQALVEFIVRLFIVLTLALFLIAESERILDFWVQLFPSSQQARVRELTTSVGDKVGHWLLGQMAVATITGTLAGLAAALLGLPYPFLIGVVTAVLDLAPIVGPTLMVFPAFLLGLSQSLFIAIAALIVFYGIAELDGNVLSPLITGRAVSLSPTLIIIAIPMGLALYGAIGALIAVPVVAAVQVFVTEIVLPWLKERQREGERERRESELEKDGREEMDEAA